MTTQDEKEQLQRNKKRQAKLSYAASGAGLTAGALLAGSAVIRKPDAFKPKAVLAGAKNVKNVRLRKPDLSTPESRAKFADKMKDRGYLIGATGGAVGGLGGLNFARLQRKEADTLVKKNDRKQHLATSVAALGGAGVAAGYRDFTNPNRVYKNPRLENARLQFSTSRADKFKVDPAYKPYSEKFQELQGKRKRARSPATKQKWGNAADNLATSPEFKQAKGAAKANVARKLARNRKTALVGGLALTGLAGSEALKAR